MNHSFGKVEKLKSKKNIDKLFIEGQSIKKFPVKLVFTSIDGPFNKVGVSVPKRNFKRAVDRNRLKRLMRESYRLNKQLLTNNSNRYAMMFIYLDRKKTDYQSIFKAVKSCLNELNKNTAL